MKKLAASLSVFVWATSASAGALNDPVVEPQIPPAVISQEAAQSSAPTADIVLVLSMVAVFGAALAH